MEQVLVINDSANGELFAIVTEKNGSLRSYGANKPGKQWAAWLDQTQRGRGRLDAIAKRLPLGLSTEGPRTMTRKVRAELSAVLPKITENAREEIATGRVESKSLIIQLGQKPPASRTVIRRNNQKDWNAQVNYKALAFINDANLAGITYEIKRTRAVFDPDLGPSGGFRCPVGTRYGGQITDRFGRGCGWGAARRLLNTVVDAGERLEEIGDRRRDRRVQRRNRRVTRRLGRSVSDRTGRLERVARGADRFAGRARRFAERMDGNPGQPRGRRGERTITGGRIDRAANRADRFAGRARRLADRILEGGDGRERRREAMVDQANAAPRPSRRRPTVEAGRVERPAESKRPAKKAPAKKAPAKKAAAKKAPAKKAAAKKAAAKKVPAKRVPAKKAPAKKATSIRPSTARSDRDPLALDRLAGTDREFVEDFIRNQGLFLDSDGERRYVENAAQNLRPDGLDEMARNLENAARDDRRKAQSEGRNLRDRIAYNEVANRKEERARELRRRAEVERVQQANAADSQRPRKQAAKKVPVKKAAKKRSASRRPASPEPAAANPPNPPSNPTLNDLNTDDRTRAQGLINNSLGFDPEELNRRVERRIASRDRNDIQNRINVLTGSVEADKARLRGRDKDDLFNRVVDNELIKRREDMIRRYQEALRDIPDPNAPRSPLPEERVAELEMEVADRYARLREKRGGIIGRYMKKRYGDGDPPPWKTDRNLSVDEVRRLASGSAADKERVKQWILQIYKHDEVEVRGGQKFRTTNVNVSVSGRSSSVSGNIESFNTRANRWEKVGSFSRTLNYQSGQPAFVYNSRMMMGKEDGIRTAFAEEAKNSGWTSVFNPHAFTWLKASGFERAEVSAAHDGKFVWGKSGFRQQNTQLRPGGKKRLTALVDGMNNEVRKYRNGRASIIRTDLDADLVAYLAQVATARNYSIDAPQHPEFVLALRGPENMTAEEREDYDAKIKDWFVSVSPFGSGRFDFDDENVPDDPRELA